MEFKKMHKVTLFSIMLALCGCASFYKNSGSRTIVGDVSAPVDVSDTSDTVNCKLLYSLTGASVWTAKDSVVSITYSNIYTNSYLGCVEKVGSQSLSVDIVPLTSTNIVSEVTSNVTE